MLSILVGGSLIVFVVFLCKFHDRLGNVESGLAAARADIKRLERRSGAAVAEPPPSRKPAAAARPTVPERPRVPVPPNPTTQRSRPVAPAAVPAERPPSDPRRPAAIATGNGAWDRLWGMNLPAKLGALITLLGFSFLLKLAIDQGWFSFPIWARHLAVGIAGLSFVAAGWRMRDSHRHLARALLGTGFATIHLTIYSAVLVFSVLTPGIGFALVVVATVGTGVFAGTLHSRAFAILAIVGGLAAPMLLPDAASQVTAVLGYYAILSGPTLWLAWRERWPDLNLLAFLGVFGSSLIWVLIARRGEHFALETEPLLWLLFVLYAAVLIVTHVRRGFTKVRILERVLLYATPGATLSLIAIVLLDSVDLAWRALAIGVFYAFVAFALHRTQRAGSELILHFVAVACGFTALAVPLRFDGYTVAALWALGGAFQVIAGSLRRSLGFSVAGIGLLIAAGFVWFIEGAAPDGATAFANGSYVTAAWIGALALLSAWLLDHRAGKDWATAMAWVPFCWGACWWLGAGLWELERVLDTEFTPAAFLLFTFGTALVAWGVESRRRWSKLGLVAPLAAVGLVAAFILTMGSVAHPSAYNGWLAWPFAIAVFLRFVLRNEADRPHAFPYGYALVHALFVAGMGWEVQHQVSRISGGIWPVVAIGVFLIFSALFRLTPALSSRWPAGPSRDGHLKWIPATTAVVALGTVLLLQLSPGDPIYFPFVPLLNPVDVLAGLFLVLLYRTCREDDPQVGPAIVTVLGWGFSSLTIARTVHHWTGVPFDLAALYDSMTLQTSLTVYWSLLGVLGMILGTRRSLRPLWKAAAGLMALVLFKLFVVDLSGVNTAARIISFLGVGGLLLLLGYLAPQPPKITSRLRS